MNTIKFINLKKQHINDAVKQSKKESLFFKAMNSIQAVKELWNEASDLKRVQLLTIYFDSIKSLIKVSRNNKCNGCLEKNLRCGLNSFCTIKKCKNESYDVLEKSAQYAHYFFQELHKVYGESEKKLEQQRLAAWYRQEKQNLVNK